MSVKPTKTVHLTKPVATRNVVIHVEKLPVVLELSARQNIILPSVSALVVSREMPLLTALMLAAFTMRNVRKMKYVTSLGASVSLSAEDNPVPRELPVLLRATVKYVAVTLHCKEMDMFSALTVSSIAIYTSVYPLLMPFFSLLLL